jgi:hypothetical protein
VASKFDGKRAGENFWVMQQNLAKQKGGRQPHWFQQPRPPKIAKGPTSPAALKEEKADPSPPASPEVPSTED